MPAQQRGVDVTVLKGARKACHQARDSYYQCVDKESSPSDPADQVPKACQKARTSFEKLCRASWVKHFDALREKDVQLLRALHSNINQGALQDRRRERDYRREEDRDRDRGRDRDRERSYRDSDLPRARDYEGRREHDREGNRIRERDRDRDRDREKERGRERDRKDDRSHRKSEREEGKQDAALSTKMEIDGEQAAVEHAAVDLNADITPEEMQMMQSMGIPFGFTTTQGQHVDDDKSNAGGVKIKQTRRARQYMNRKGGFNRALPSEQTGRTALRD